MLRNQLEFLAKILKLGKQTNILISFSFNIRLTVSQNKFKVDRIKYIRNKRTTYLK